MSPKAVEFKGRNGYLEILLNEHVPYEQICEALGRKLETTRSFFASASCKARVAGRLLSDEQKKEITDILQQGLHMASVEFIEKADNEEADAKEARGKEFDAEEAKAAAVEEVAEMPTDITLDDGLAEVADARKQVAEDEVSVENILLTQPLIGQAMIFGETLRSGNRVVFDGHVVVLGDINNGASVMASGNIIVLGTLRGLAHAGAFGDESAYIFAHRMDAQQLRIAAQIGVAPEGKATKGQAPEYAKLKDGVITIQPYNGNMRSV